MKTFSFMMQGRFAHFCKPYTNVYKLTQPCPSKTAVMGFLGSALGIKKDDLRLYNKIKCGVEICFDYRTISMPYTARKDFPGRKGNEEHTIIPVEVIVNPKYLITVVACNGASNGLFIDLYNLLRDQAPVFTPYLGLAQYIASTDFQTSKIVDGDIIDDANIEVNGAFIRGIHGELDIDKLNLKGEYHIAEFEGLKRVEEPRIFKHAMFTVSLNSLAVPILNSKDVLSVPEWSRNVPIF